MFQVSTPDVVKGSRDLPLLGLNTDCEQKRDSMESNLIECSDHPFTTQAYNFSKRFLSKPYPLLTHL